MSRNMTEGLDNVTQLAEETKVAVDVSWTVVSTALVFLMQAGFTMVEVGSVRIKNTKSILVKNLLDACVGSIMFYLYGWAFCFGTGNSFIGYDGFLMLSGFNSTEGPQSDNPAQYASWTFHCMFCVTASTIVSGAVAERTQLVAYFVYTFFLVTIIYPPVAHWIWTEQGWASSGNEHPLFGVGALDFAGVFVVHVVGGAAALIGCVLVGARQGRFVKQRASKVVKQNAVFQVLGTLILWFGWYGFNCGSTAGLGGGLTVVAAKTGVTTTVSAATAGGTTILLNYFLDRKVDPGVICNGILGGLVSITGACAFVQPYSALIIGIVGAHMYYFSSKLLLKLEIDDVVDASPVHMFCGIWGGIATGLFCHPDNYKDLYSEDDEHNGYGLFYDGSKGGKLLAANLVYLLAVLSYVAAIATPLFYILKRLRLLRVNNIEEHRGQDKVHHGGRAYENPVGNNSSASGVSTLHPSS